MLTGRLIAESLQVGTDITIPGLRVIRLGRHDVSASTTPSSESDSDDTGAPAGATEDQPQIWTFVDFEAPDEQADALAQAIAAALETTTGWWADFTVEQDRVIVFANRVFRYRIGDKAGHDEAIAWGLAAGTPHHQLDWGD
jgi:hypothetical protein